MRRKNREVSDIASILDILDRCDTIRIAISPSDSDVAGYPYVVPVSFGWEVLNNKTVIYFHCAKQGMKIDMLEKHPKVCIEGDIFIKIEPTKHGITARYESVIGFGHCSFATDKDEILHGLKILLDHYGYSNYPLDRCIGLEHLFVGKIVLDEITGKRNLPDPGV